MGKIRGVEEESAGDWRNLRQQIELVGSLTFAFDYEGAPSTMSSEIITE